MASALRTRRKRVLVTAVPNGSRWKGVDAPPLAAHDAG
jgi:hypothetical protein